jgi:hypothetical protein
MSPFLLTPDYLPRIPLIPLSVAQHIPSPPPLSPALYFRLRYFSYQQGYY